MFDLKYIIGDRKIFWKTIKTIPSGYLNNHAVDIISEYAAVEIGKALLKSGVIEIIQTKLDENLINFHANVIAMTKVDLLAIVKKAYMDGKLVGAGMKVESQKEHF